MKVEEFVEKIPSFNPGKIGNRKMYFSIPRNLISLYSEGLLLTTALFSNKEDAFFEKYYKVILGVSWFDFVIFEEAKTNNEELVIKESILLSSIAEIKMEAIISKENKKKISNEQTLYKIKIRLKNKKTINLKIDNNYHKPIRLDESRIMSDKDNQYN